MKIKEYRKQVSKVIKKYRLASGMDNATFANKMDRSSGHISLVENGYRSFNLVDLQKAMNILKIPSDKIFTLLD